MRLKKAYRDTALETALPATIQKRGEYRFDERAMRPDRNPPPAQGGPSVVNTLTGASFNLHYLL
jgi:hypothetical protein